MVRFNLTWTRALRLALRRSYWLSYTGWSAVAQVYTAGITGKLTSVKIMVSSLNAGPILVEILGPTTQTNVTWSLLGYTTIRPPKSLSCSPACQLTSASFSRPIPQVAGKQYAIAVYPAYIGEIWAGSTGS